MSLKTVLFKAMDATAGAFLCRLYGHINCWAGNGPPSDPIPQERIRHILVIRPGGMGDMILLMPLLAALRTRFPAAAIDLICERRNMAVLRLADWQGNILCYDANPLSFRWKLKRGGYDLVIDSEQFHNFSAVFGHWTGAPARIGFKVNPYRNPLYTHLINYDLDGPESRQFERLVQPLGIRDSFPHLEGLWSALSLSLPAGADDALRRAGITHGFAALNVGAHSAIKNWPAGQFVEIAARLHREHGLGSVLVGSRGERGISRDVLNRILATGCPAMAAAGGYSLKETAALLKRARLFLGGDSGLSHLAVALGVPSVTIFGPSDPKKWGFENGKHAVVRNELPCAPCFIFGYHRPCRTIACMRGVTVDEVMAACRKVM